MLVQVLARVAMEAMYHKSRARLGWETHPLDEVLNSNMQEAYLVSLHTW